VVDAVTDAAPDLVAVGHSGADAIGHLAADLVAGLVGDLAHKSNGRCSRSRRFSRSRRSLADSVDAQFELEFSGRCSHSCSPRFMHIELHIQWEI
jgi:hypothetical protein